MTPLMWLCSSNPSVTRRGAAAAAGGGGEAAAAALLCLREMLMRGFSLLLSLFVSSSSLRSSPVSLPSLPVLSAQNYHFYPGNQTSI